MKEFKINNIINKMNKYRMQKKMIKLRKIENKQKIRLIILMKASNKVLMNKNNKSYKKWIN